MASPFQYLLIVAVCVWLAAADLESCYRVHCYHCETERIARVCPDKCAQCPGAGKKAAQESQVHNQNKPPTATKTGRADDTKKGESSYISDRGLRALLEELNWPTVPPEQQSRSAVTTQPQNNRVVNGQAARSVRPRVAQVPRPTAPQPAAPQPQATTLGHSHGVAGTTTAAPLFPPLPTLDPSRPAESLLAIVAYFSLPTFPPPSSGGPPVAATTAPAVAPPAATAPSAVQLPNRVRGSSPSLDSLPTHVQTNDVQVDGVQIRRPTNVVDGQTGTRIGRRKGGRGKGGNRVIVRPRQRARGFKRIRVRTGGRRRGNKRQPPRAKSLPNFSRSIDGAPDEGDDWEIFTSTGKDRSTLPKAGTGDAGKRRPRIRRPKGRGRTRTSTRRPRTRVVRPRQRVVPVPQQPIAPQHAPRIQPPPPPVPAPAPPPAQPQCPILPHYSPCISKEAANARFTQCCAPLGAGCVALCTYDVRLPQIQLAVLTGQCRLNIIGRVLTCASGNEDATPCCTAKGVFGPGTEHCGPYCNPAAGLPQGEGERSLRCLSKFTQIQQCFHATLKP